MKWKLVYRDADLGLAWRGFFKDVEDVSGEGGQPDGFAEAQVNHFRLNSREIDFWNP